MSEFSGEPGLRFDLQDDAKADHYFLKVFGEQTVDLIVEETNRYARQSLRNNPPRLATWKNVSKEELKAYLGVCVIMGINQLPRIGIKVWMAADSKNGYVINYNVYLGSEEGVQRIHGLGYDVVMKMIQPSMNKNRHVYFDNIFSSPVLLEHLELQQTCAFSTVRCNRKGLLACASNKLTRPGQLVQAQKGNIVFTKWHDKRDVAFLATNVSPGEASRTVR